MRLLDIDSLPYVHTFVDRHGKTRHYFRRKGECVPLKGDLGSAEFAATYQAALHGLPSEKQRHAISRIKRAQKLSAPKPQVGVYLLMLDGAVAYVGSSLNMQKRVKKHRENGRPFDKAFFIAAAANERLALERTLIAAIKPPGNKDQKPNPDLQPHRSVLANPRIAAVLNG